MSMIYVCDMNQQNEHFLHYRFNLIIVPSTRFEHPSVHPQEDLQVLFYGIFSCIHISSLVDGRMSLILILILNIMLKTQESSTEEEDCIQRI